MKPIALAFVMAALPVAAFAEVQSKKVEYRHGDQTLVGYLAWDDAVAGARPGVMVVHEWWGLNDYARRRADQLAELGYVAFAADMYGDGKITQHAAEAREWAGQVRANQDAWRERALAGLAVLREQELVDPERLAAIGYCFGGSTALQIAFSGADVDGVVSFHGALPIPTDAQAAQTKAAILVCHGASDPFIPADVLQQFRDKVSTGGVDWRMIYYGGALHSFTNPDAGAAGVDGLRYNADADRRSWDDMQVFFREVFAEKTGS